MEFDKRALSPTPDGGRGRRWRASCFSRAARASTLGIIGGTGCGKTTLVRLADAGLRRDGRRGARGRARMCGNIPPGPGCTGKIGHGAAGGAACSAARCAAICSWARQTRRRRASCGRRWRRPRARTLCAKSPTAWTRPWRRAAKTFPAARSQRLTIARALAAKPAGYPGAGRFRLSALDYATDAALRRALQTADGRHDGRDDLASGRPPSRTRTDILVLDDGRPAGLGTCECCCAPASVPGNCRSQKLLENGACAPGLHEQIVPGSAHGAAGGAQPPQAKVGKAHGHTAQKGGRA